VLSPITPDLTQQNLPTTLTLNQKQKLAKIGSYLSKLKRKKPKSTSSYNFDAYPLTRAVK